MRDQVNDLYPKRGLSPVSVADNTAQVSQIIDTAGFEALSWFIAAGSIADADATFTVLLEESAASDMSGSNAVADADLIGTEALASFIFSDDNKVFKLGYKGSKRYVRMTVTPSGNASAAVLCIIPVLGFPTSGPTANPPV